MGPTRNKKLYYKLHIQGETKFSFFFSIAIRILYYVTLSRKGGGSEKKEGKIIHIKQHIIAIEQKKKDYI